MQRLSSVVVRALGVALTALALSSCGLLPEVKDETAGWSADRLYQTAHEAMMRDARWLAGLRLLKKYDLSWDLRVKTWELEAAAQVVRGIPDIPVVLNHAGFPWDRSAGGLENWRKGMRALAACPNVWCKVSCLLLRDGAWDYEDNRRIVLEAQQGDRLER